jgi:hypothetical protein
MRSLFPAWIALASCTLAGCTLATDATDRKVDPSLARDLNYTFSKMDAHQTEALDVVLVSEPADLADAADGGVKLRLRTHARIVLPPLQAGVPYPDKTLVLRNAMEPGQPHRILFYADSDDDNQIDYGILTGVPGAEHIWNLDVPPSGVDTFVHSTNFKDFFESDYSPTGDVVLALTAPAPDWRPAACANRKDHSLEVRITLAPDGEAREIGYYRNYASNKLPDKPIVLKDIADSGNTYLFEVLIDGELARPPFTKSAPTVSGQDLVIAQGDWYPAAPTTPSCD